jgi:ubiquinone/menaquinone biosynthesis C-methylase UbiE
MSRSTIHDTRTPDIETSGDDYARRFDGPVGVYFLDVQARSVESFLQKLGNVPRILEVGGGHAQLTGFLRSRGHAVVVQGSDPICARRVQPLLSPGSSNGRFVASDLLSLPFRDESFDVVIAVRLLAHVNDDDTFLAELGRVARRAVIVDFAPLASANVLAPVLFRVKRLLEGNTRPFFVHSRLRLARKMRRLGFERFNYVKQFAVPMGLHRAIGRPSLSERSEAVMRSCGITRLIGSPVMMLAQKKTG